MATAQDKSEVAHVTLEPQHRHLADNPREARTSIPPSALRPFKQHRRPRNQPQAPSYHHFSVCTFNEMCLPTDVLSRKQRRKARDFSRHPLTPPDILVGAMIVSREKHRLVSREKLAWPPLLVRPRELWVLLPVLGPLPASLRRCQTNSEVASLTWSHERRLL